MTPATPPVWQRWLPRACTVVAVVATLSCLGLSALVSLATAIGATFLTHDATLRPLLTVSLLLTIAGSVLTWRRHRNPLPLLLTTAAAALIFWTLYGGAGMGQDVMAGGHHLGGHHLGGISVWVGLALLLAAQVWDVWRLRVFRRRVPRAA